VPQVPHVLGHLVATPRSLQRSPVSFLETHPQFRSIDSPSFIVTNLLIESAQGCGDGGGASGLDVGKGTVLQVPHVFGHIVETPISLQRLSVSKFETQTQLRLITCPFLFVVNRSVESTHSVGDGGECTVGEIVGETVCILPPIGLRVDGGAIKLQILALCLAQANLH